MPENYIGLILHIANGRANRNGLINDHLDIFPYGEEMFGICHRTKFGGGDNSISKTKRMNIANFLVDIAEIKSEARRQFNGTFLGNKGDIAKVMEEAYKHSESLGVAVFGRSDNNIIGYTNPLVVLFHPKEWVPKIESEYIDVYKHAISTFRFMSSFNK